MNYAIIQNMHDFEQITESPIFIGCDKKLLNTEISTNMWAISLDDKIIKNISLDKLLEFINNLVSKKKQQLSQLNISCPVIFYMWFDEMASQLRFNFISGLHEKLPFGCKLNIIDSPYPILTGFLQSQSDDKIPWKDLEEITNDYNEIEENIFTLDVFLMQLNDDKNKKEIDLE